MTSYRSTSTSVEVVLADEVLTHVLAHRQRKFWSKEAGGQLFGRFWKGAAIVHLATGPRPTDRRSRRSFQSDPAAEQAEIDEMHAVGLHYLGTWHTHPECVPTPSGQDISTMEHTFSNAIHELSGFLLLIVGTADPPIGVYLGMINRGRTSLFLPIVKGAAPTVTAWGPDGLLIGPKIQQLNHPNISLKA